MAGQCGLCGGRGWKYASPRRGVVAAEEGAGETVAGERVTVECLGCQGSGTVPEE
ncbi:hypothetical protein [Microbispora siamensis]|uniref:hypothetical protein n=1 Tax=Microbispora siamensis TaxID=564413 RepID=UPI0019522DD4|nr:hypothetical protein [Microbispora siamensis]